MREKTMSLSDFLRDKNLSQITSLNLSGQNLKKWPSEIFKCRNLRKLNLSNNQIDYIPKDITDLSKLRVLNLSDNNLTRDTCECFSCSKIEGIER